MSAVLCPALRVDVGAGLVAGVAPGAEDVGAVVVGTEDADSEGADAAPLQAARTRAKGRARMSEIPLGLRRTRRDIGLISASTTMERHIVGIDQVAAERFDGRRSMLGRPRGGDADPLRLVA